MLLRAGCVGLAAAGLIGEIGGCRSARVEAPDGLVVEVRGERIAARIYTPGSGERRYRVEGTMDIESRLSEEADESGAWSVLIQERENDLANSTFRAVRLRRGADSAIALASIGQMPGGLTTFDPPIAVMPAGGVAALRPGDVFLGEARVHSAGEYGPRSGRATHETELLGFDTRGRVIVRQRLFMDLGVVTVERALMITADAEGIVREEQARTVKFGLFVVDRAKREIVRISE